MRDTVDTQRLTTLDMAALCALWKALGDVPVNEADEIEEGFLHFDENTHREFIWHWFEAMNPDFVVGRAMTEGDWIDSMAEKAAPSQYCVQEVFTSTYECPCNNTWESTWTSACDDECSECLNDVTPTVYTTHTALMG